jgi:glutamyl-tRNA synthetase
VIELPAASSTSVRVRFAPSPTGFLHVGGARTAIFNWLFARRYQGSLVLRIEDTDVERSTRESEGSLIDDLRWLGLDWDEGADRSGPYAPYRQSERLDLYSKRADELVSAGHAFPCFCSDQVIQAKRQEATKKGLSPRYDGTCRKLGQDEIAAKREQRQPEVIRFEVPDDVVRIDDVVRGAVELATNTVGDFVLVRSNGHPTYNFAAAVDDHAMGITHVLRGEEHLPNTLRQILVYNALGADIPKFGHLPLILAEDRSKLSKRHGASSVGELRKLGFLPGAVMNYLVLLGWSHPDGVEILSIEDLKQSFSIERVNKSAAVYDKKKLAWMNGQYVRKTPLDDLFETADRFFPDYVHATYSESARRGILGLLHDSVETLGELAEASSPFRSPPAFDEEAMEVVETSVSDTVLSALKIVLESAPDDFSEADFKSMMKDVGKKTSVKGKALFFPVRAALTGSVHGPELAGIATVKGKARLLDLIERARSMRTG